mmetsp:Transcript_12243/g.28562  ORF Transcript_12243/g.28562 Transcript_12243/m.28562 type:complete len:231 (+) Transcript_12243:117-809(+)
MGRQLGRRTWQANAGPKAVRPEHDGPDLINYNAYMTQWDGKHQRRNLRSLSLYREGQSELALEQGSKPWASLSELRPGHREDLESTRAGARRSGTGSLPPGSPMLPPGQQELLRPNSSSARSVSSSRPPRTSSTTLTSVWRKALATPEPGSLVDEYGVRRTKNWEDLNDKMSKEELADLIEHVHSRIVAERRRRKELEADRRSKADGKTAAQQPAATTERLQDRQPTPAR